MARIRRGSLIFLCAVYVCSLHLPVSAAFLAHTNAPSHPHSLPRRPVRATAVSPDTTSSLHRRSHGDDDFRTSKATSPSTHSAPTDPALAVIRQRRLSSIIGGLAHPDLESFHPKNIPHWLSTLKSTGKWPESEVDYTTGCQARRANWPAQDHWLRIVVMAGAWHGGLEGAEKFARDDELRIAISQAMDYWFSRDFTHPACIDSGGTAACPCSNLDNSLWNTNWFSSVILIPKLVGQSCLILSDTLESAQLRSCMRMTSRSYAKFGSSIIGVGGGLTGANALDVARIGMDQGLLTSNVSMLADAYHRVHSELAIMNKVRADGIRADGSFGQHDGILYNGNYGMDYANAMLDMEIEAAGTDYAANKASRSAFATLFDGDRWMIFRDAVTGVLHWDFSVLGRFISFPVADKQPTASIHMNVTEIGELGKQWSSESLVKFAQSLSRDGTNANAGSLIGNHMFYANDYMVHRGRNYVSTLKLWSSRTRHTECTNLQNPLGFHLSDGVSFNYVRGDEYEDIAAAWNWNLIPGITVDYGATHLACANTRLLGVESFVGGVSNGRVGMAAMRYTNPLTKALRWRKAWFFLQDDIQHVMIANISSTSSAPVYSVLDQRRRSGPILVDGSPVRKSKYAGAESLWHDDVGYTFSDSEDAATSLSVEIGEKTGDWEAIGTSTEPPVAVDLFAAWIEHKTLSRPVSYTVFPGVSAEEFRKKKDEVRLQSVQSDGVSAVFDEASDTAMVAFWNPSGGSMSFVPHASWARVTIASSRGIAVIYELGSGDVTVSDPSQSLSTVRVELRLGLGRKPQGWGTSVTKSLVYVLPQGGLAGSSVTRNVK